MKNILAAALTAVISAAAMASAHAADAPNSSVLRVAPGLPSHAITVVRDRAVVLESALPFTEISVAQPSIADVSPLSDRSIYLFGRSLGTTSLAVLGQGGTLITNVTVQVIPDIAGLQSEIGRVLDR